MGVEEVEARSKPILSRGLGVIGRREMMCNLSCTKGKNYLQEDKWNMSLSTGWIGCEVWKGGRSEMEWKEDERMIILGKCMVKGTEDEQVSLVAPILLIKGEAKV